MTLETVTERTIFLALTGSHAYGLSTPDSDEDYRGVCIPTIEYFLGFDRFEQQEYPDEDKVVYDIRKAFKLFADGNPNMLELLWMDREKCPVWTPIWDRIVTNRNLFLSSKVRWTYMGYAFAQLRRVKHHKRWLDNPPKKQERKEFGLPPHEKGVPTDLLSAVIAAAEYVRPEHKKLAIAERHYAENKREWDSYQTWLKNRNRQRFELEKKYGYDVKHASHLVRLIRQGRELLETGNLYVDRTGIDADELRAIKEGAWSYEDIIKYADDMENEFDVLYTRTALPKKPQRKAIIELCVDICSNYLKEKHERTGEETTGTKKGIEAEEEETRTLPLDDPGS